MLCLDEMTDVVAKGRERSQMQQKVIGPIYLLGKAVQYPANLMTDNR